MYKTIDISYKCEWVFFVAGELNLISEEISEEKLKLENQHFLRFMGSPLKGQERGMAFVLPRRY